MVVQDKVTQALDYSINPVTILNQGMMAAMDEVGRRFECGEFFVPEILIAARAMQTGMALLKSRLQKPMLRRQVKLLLARHRVIYMISAKTWLQ